MAGHDGPPKGGHEKEEGLFEFELEKVYGERAKGSGRRSQGREEIIDLVDRVVPTLDDGVIDLTERVDGHSEDREGAIKKENKVESAPRMVEDDPQPYAMGEMASGVTLEDLAFDFQAAAGPRPGEGAQEPREGVLISEEKVEAIVTRVVGQVVERVVRETVERVAERVIGDAIKALKESLEAQGK